MGNRIGLRIKMLKKTPLIEKIESVIEPVIEDMGFELVRVSVIGTGKPILEIMVDTVDADTNIKLDECGEISKAISAVMDVENVMGDKAYMLDVGSPGVDRPLTKLNDFDRYTGRKAKIETDTLIEGRKRFKGEIMGLKENNVLLKDEDGVINIPVDYIEKAKLYMDEDLLQRQLKGK